MVRSVSTSQSLRNVYECILSVKVFGRQWDTILRAAILHNSRSGHLCHSVDYMNGTPGVVQRMTVVLFSDPGIAHKKACSLVMGRENRFTNGPLKFLCYVWVGTPMSTLKREHLTFLRKVRVSRKFSLSDEALPYTESWRLNRRWSGKKLSSSGQSQ